MSKVDFFFPKKTEQNKWIPIPPKFYLLKACPLTTQKANENQCRRTKSTKNHSSYQNPVTQLFPIQRILRLKKTPKSETKKLTKITMNSPNHKNEFTQPQKGSTQRAKMIKPNKKFSIPSQNWAPKSSWKSKLAATDTDFGRKKKKQRKPKLTK